MFMHALACGQAPTKKGIPSTHLDVAVGDAHAVAVVQPDEELLEEPPRLVLGAPH